jgi:cullin 3
MGNKVKKDFLEVKKEVEDEMINKILNYLRTGSMECLVNNKPGSYMTAYTSTQTFADLGDEQSEKLFTYFKNKITSFIEDCSHYLANVSNSYLIEEFIKNTTKTNFLSYWMIRVFCYLDRFYTKAKIKASLGKTAKIIYITNFFDNFRKNIFIEVNKLILEDRRGNRESRHQIKAVMKIIKDLDLQFPKIFKENNRILWEEEKDEKGELLNKDLNYTPIQDDWYNNYFESETTKFATEKGNTDIQSMSAPEYILSQLKYLDEEYERESEFINQKFHVHINKINYKCLIGNHMRTIADMDTGINKMLETKNTEQLEKLYKLFKLYPESLKEITEKFQPYIKARGNAIYENKELSKDPKKFIPELINLKKEMDKLVIDCFENNTDFQDVKNKAFSLFMKKDVYAKQLSNYADFCMRSGFKGKTQEEIDRTLNDIIDLFKCLNAKLVFQNESNKKMSERLIKKQSLSTLSERSLITKLKQEAGVTYVSKMQEMMNDLDKNKTETENYKLSAHKGAPNGIKLDITVISQSAWEISKKAMEKIELPKFLQYCIDDFETYYVKKHQGQKLLWCLGLSKIEIEYLYLKNKNISISTLPQLLSLLHLEKEGKLSIGKIAELCGCQISTIINDIQGLVFNPSFNPHGQADKGIIIGNFNAQTKEFKESDEISINRNFVSSRVKIQTLPLAQKKSASEVKQAEIEEAQIIKKYQDNILQATLTRIMKSKIGQETTHVWLVNEAAKQIDLFKAQPQQIKENIEKLIEKNVIKRNEKNRTCYDYIA